MTFLRFLMALSIASASLAEAAPNYVWKEEGSFVACHQVMDEVNGRQATILVPNDRCRKPPTFFALKDFGGISHCVELDTETAGQRIRLPAAMEKCPKGETLFRWERRALLSECWEVDTLTAGKRFRAPAGGSRCEKPATRFEERRAVLEYGCFEVDIESGGGQFIAEAPLSKCKNGLNPNFWADDPRPAVGVKDSQINRSWLPKTPLQRVREWISGGEAEKNQDAR